MSRPSSFARAEIDIDPEARRVRETPEPEISFRILLLGDFTGRSHRGIRDKTLAGRRPVLVDRDNFDQVLGTLAPRLRLGHTELSFAELDDFHPDRIYARAEVFAILRGLREKVSDRATFAAAAAELQPTAPPGMPPTVLRLEDLLGGAIEDLEQARTRRTDDWSRFLDELVRPHLVPKPDPKQADMIAQTDAAITAVMRRCLHHRDFQALESAWRGLFFLVSRIETGPRLKLYILDVSKDELSACLAESRDIRSTAIYRILVDEAAGTPGADAWSVLAADYAFGPGIPDIKLLALLGGIARAAGAPFIAAATPALLEPAPEDARVWDMLRSLPESCWIGLALPRFLLRLPYGAKTSSVDQFAFEEFEGIPAHEDYLWGNPAFPCVCLLTQAFSRSAWQMSPGEVRDIGSLPAHVYQENGESKLKPCAERLLTERDANAILERGLMPLLSIKDSDAVRLYRFQSIANPPSALPGPWA